MGILLRICFIIFSITVTSCTKEEITSSSAVELLSFGPSGAQHGEQIKFIGNNLHRVTSIELTGATVPSSAFVEHTSELIVIVVPQEAERGLVVLKTPGGDITSKSPLNLEVPVVITSVTERARPGENITITGQYMNWITEVIFANDIVVDDFISQSLTEIVITVPQDAQTGPLVIITGGTEPLTIETEEELVVTLPSITTLSPNPVERNESLTITGENLDLTMGVLFRGITEPITEFISKSADELVVAVPEEANRGTITLIAYSGVTVESEEAINLIGDLPPLAPLAYALYIDGFENGWGNWGWGGTVDFNNTENVRDGDVTIKKEFDGTYGALRFGRDDAVTIAAHTEVVFSIFGTAGMGGLQLNVIANEQWGAPHIITIVEGEWVEFKLSKADLNITDELKDLLFQDRGWSGTVYVDHVGLR